MPTSPQLAALVARIDAALPQTQCTRCGYPDCAAYAQAVALGQAGINQCPPGGAQGVQRLAALTGQPVQPLNPAHGEEGPRALAVIDENWCIGCTLCIAACPTDAIMGANKHMHTILEAHCTGCELCVPVCPVDCIHMVNASGQATGWQAWSPAQAEHARQRYTQRQQRLQRPAAATAAATAAANAELLSTAAPAAAFQPPPQQATSAPSGADDATARKATIAAVLARARAQAGKASS